MPRRVNPDRARSVRHAKYEILKHMMATTLGDLEYDLGGRRDDFGQWEDPPARRRVEKAMRELAQVLVPMTNRLKKYLPKDHEDRS